MRNNLNTDVCCPRIRSCKSNKKTYLPSIKLVSCANSERTSIKSIARSLQPQTKEETTCCESEPICQPCEMPLENCNVALCTSQPFCIKRRYIQPKVVESFRPVRQYIPPVIPMPNATVYNKSFEHVDDKTAALCRVSPARPKNSLKIPPAQFTNDTVTKLSFPPPCPASKTLPIRPNPKSMLTKGLEHQMQSLTTQKHDFVPKCQGRRQKMIPADKIKKRCGVLEQKTTQKLSFMIPDNCHFTKAVSCKPKRFYEAPVLPFSKETTQNMSFMPVRPLEKEIYPWAEKKKYIKPVLKFAKDTVNKTSYMLPGTFMDEICDCKCAQECKPSIAVNLYPRAGL